MDLTKIESPKFSMPKIMQMPVDLTDEESEIIQNVIHNVVKNRVSDYTSQWLRYMADYTTMLNKVYTESSDKAYEGYKKRKDKELKDKLEEFTERIEIALGNVNNLVWLATFRECGLSAGAVEHYLHVREEMMEDLKIYGPLALYHLTFDGWENMVYDYTPDMLKDMEQFKDFRVLDMKAKNYYDAKKRGTLDEE